MPYWVQRGSDFLVQVSQCRSCGRSLFPVQPGCLACGSDDLDIVEIQGVGRIESFTAIEGCPVCEVRLDAGPMVMGYMDVDAPATVGSRVRLQPSDGRLRFIFDD